MTKQVRLTIHIRDQIIKALMEKRFKKELAELQAKEVELGVRVYQAIYPDWKTAQKLSEGWLCTNSSVRFRMDGQYHSLILGKSMPVPYGSKMRTIPSAELAKEVRDHIRSGEALNSKRNSARQQAKSVIYSVQTVKRLLEIWPEVKPFLPKDMEQPVTTLALPISQVNSIFDLGG